MALKQVSNADQNVGGVILKNGLRDGGNGFAVKASNLTRC